jgi:hypothetical protein
MALSYNWSITDQSPLITYTPLSLGNETTIWNSWNSSYSLTPWNVSELSDYTSLVGKGQSSHTSTAAQASAKIGFAGTAVYVWGESYQLSAVISVDGVDRGFSTGQTDLIGAVTNLSNAWHEVEVVVRGLAEVQIHGFTFTSELEGYVFSAATADQQDPSKCYD